MLSESGFNRPVLERLKETIGHCEGESAMNVRPMESPDDAAELPLPQPGQLSAYLETELALVGLIGQTFTRTISNGYFTPDPALAVHGQEGRLIPELRLAAAIQDPTEILTRAAIRHCQAMSAPMPPGFEGLSAALADLSVTGASAYSKFETAPPDPDQIKLAVLARYQATPTLMGLPPGPTPTDAQASAAVAFVLDRAYEVAWFIRGASARGNLGWIAVSAEDDFPHRPVNVPATAYPQFDAVVTVPVNAPAAPAIRVQTRYTIASAAPPVKPPLMFGSASPPVPAPRSLPPVVSPGLPPNNRIILYIHGSDSRLEEAESVMPHLVGTPGAPTGFSVISVDLPGSGYVNPIDPDEVGVLTPTDGLINPGFVYDVVLMPFIEQFIVNFCAAVSSALHQPGLVEERLIATMGGSLGGNMSLRLGRRPDLFPNVVAYSAGSVWDSFYQTTGLHSLACWTVLPRARELPPGGRLAATAPQVEAPTTRAEFFGIAFDQVMFPFIDPHSQPDMWYRDGWQYKADYINDARLDRWEIYNPATRRWHWRISLEELIFSWVEPFAGPTQPQVPGSYVGAPACQEVKSRLLLGAGAADNYVFANIFTSTQTLAGLMVGNDGDTFFLDRTGHSIHAERPGTLAAKVLAFLSPRQHVVYKGADNHIVELWWQPSTGWHIAQVSLQTGTAAVTAAGNLSGYVHPDRSLHVFFRGLADNLIHELWWSATRGWQVGTLSGTPGALAAAGDPSSYVEDSGVQHLVYRGVDNKIHEFWRSPASGGWQVGKLSDTVGAQLAAGDPCGYAEPGVQHVVYRGTDNKIHEFWWSPASGVWQVGKLSDTQGAQLASGDPVAYADAGVQHVMYRGTDNKIHEFYWTLANGWQVGSLSDTQGAQLAAGDPISYADAGVQHVMYRGTDNKIHEFYWTPAKSWQIGSLSDTQGAAPAAGDPCGYADADGVQHVMYRGTDSLIHEFYWTLATGWQIGTVNTRSGTAASDPVDFVL